MNYEKQLNKLLLKELSKRKEVMAEELSTMRMSCGNAKKYPIVIHKGEVKDWVGFGWVGGQKATAEDYKKYPVVVEG